MKTLYLSCTAACLLLSSALFSQTRVQGSRFGSYNAPAGGSIDGPALLSTVATEDEYDVHFYFLNLDIESTGSAITGNVLIRATVVAATMDTMALELSGFTVDSAQVAINAGVFQTATVARTGTTLDILLPLTANEGDVVQTNVYYHGTAPTSNAYPNGNGYFRGPPSFSASPPYNSDTWWPCKQNLTDKADSSWFFITANNGSLGLSNGVLADTVQLGAKTRWEWKNNHPINFYLISFTVGALSVSTEYFHGPGRTDSMPVVHYGGAGAGAVDVLTKYSNNIGLYPFYDQKLGYATVNLDGGMENQTLICMGGFSVVEHETMHQWFGDNVSVASFRDLAMSEGFARWAEVWYPELTSSTPNTTRIAGMNDYENVVLGYTAGSVYNHTSDTSSINGLYAGEGYDMYYTKAAMVINSIRGEVYNDSLFYLGLRNYQAQLGGKAAYGSDLRNIMSATTGIDFTNFFNDWYYGYGFPTYAISWNQKAGRLEMEITETTSSDSTPLFRNFLEIKVTRLNAGVEADTFIRVYIGQNVSDFNVACGDSVTGLVVDPNQWIANQTGAITKNPSLNIPCTLTEIDSVVQNGDTLLAPAYSNYQWYRDSVLLASDTLQQLVVSSAGVYSVFLTDATGCTGTVYINYSCTDSITDSIQQNGDTLLAPVSVFYQWYFNNIPLTGDTLQQLIAISPGTYTVQLTNANGCTGIAYLNSGCSLSNIDSIRQMGDTLLAPAATAYQWYLNNTTLAGDTLQQLVVSSAGNYTVQITGSGGCTGFTGINYTCSQNYMDSIGQQGDNLIAPASLYYQWYLNGAPLLGDTMQILLASVSGTYQVQTINLNGCTGLTDTLDFILNGIRSLKTETMTVIYPNPASGILLIETNNFHPEMIAIYNTSGQKISEQNFAPQMDISHLAGGIYFVEIKNAEITVRKKVVKL